MRQISPAALNRPAGTAARLARYAALPVALGVIASLSTAAAHGKAAPANTAAHRVTTGDSLWALAKASHITVAKLKAINHLTSDTAVLGSVLYLPATGLSSTAPTSPRVSSSAARNTVLSRSILSQRAYVTNSYAQYLVRSEALRQGVSVSLALAVADQESGFQQHVVSPTDAVGVMQIEPDTAAWLSTFVVGRALDRYDVHDNVVAGVSLLKTLLAATDTKSAIAAYYQGLTGVQRRGLYPETATYVASVLALRARFR